MQESLVPGVPPEYLLRYEDAERILLVHYYSVARKPVSASIGFERYTKELSGIPFRSELSLNPNPKQVLRFSTFNRWAESCHMQGFPAVEFKPFQINERFVLMWDVCDLLGVSSHRVNSWHRTDRIPHYRLKLASTNRPRMPVRFRLLEVKTWIERQSEVLLMQAEKAKTPKVRYMMRNVRRSTASR